MSLRNVRLFRSALRSDEHGEVVEWMLTAECGHCHKPVTHYLEGVDFDGYDVKRSADTGDTSAKLVGDT